MTNAQWQIREPAVAGQFYPSSAHEIKKQLHYFFADLEKPQIDFDPQALIVPHAGYMYSGKIAAYAYSAVSDKKITDIIVIGPSHHLDFDGISVYYGNYKTPLGIAQNSQELTNQLFKYHPKKIFSYPSAHQGEHSVEVQFPFLQTIFPEAKIVPIIMGSPTLENSQILAFALIELLKDRNDLLIVASSDFSHFHSYEKAVKMDNTALSYIGNFDVEGLLQAVKNGQSELCGLCSVFTSLLIFKSSTNKAIKILKYANSGDVIADKKSVVGYAAAVMGVKV
jgi:AmmeMemoRadiSam system protein B